MLDVSEKATLREWGYWTRNKLQILTDYLNTFTTAAKRSPKKVYIDLMSGSVENREKHTGRILDGSPRVALKASPPFTHLFFCELTEKAGPLETALRADFPHRDLRVIPGDCNRTFGQIEEAFKREKLTDAPTFVFIDQQAAEVEWDTIARASRLKSSAQVERTKPELWILVSPSFTIRGAAENATNSDNFRRRVDRTYGTEDWRKILRAWKKQQIDSPEWRAEMVNLFRYRLVEELGYGFTHHISMKSEKNVPMYDMVFATDHKAGDKIMRHCYEMAAKREPGMKSEALRIIRDRRETEAGLTALFKIDQETESLDVPEDLWKERDHWDPAIRPWWDD